MTILCQILFLILTYFIAAIPFGLILTKVFVKKDVRQSGSGNIGATNVTRVAGKKIGALTLVLDGLKGALMVIIARFSFSDVSHSHFFLVLVGAISVTAHVYPIYLKFKGGKGVATAIAVMMALDFSVGMLAVCFWIMGYCLFQISSVSSLIAIFSMVLTSYCYDAPLSQDLFSWFLFVLILVRHKENILRLFEGKENKV